jgi:beta-glucosidase
VAQVYVSCRNGKVFRPRRELKGFQKVFLSPGESRQVTIELDDKAYRYFNTITGKYEVETANYDILVGNSLENLPLSATVRIFGTEAPVPEPVLPSYVSGKISRVSDEEFEKLLGYPIPDGHWGQELTVLDTVSRFRQAKSPVARLIGRAVERHIEVSRKKGDPAPDSLFVFNMPIRVFAQMTKGYVTHAMADDVVFLVNGHFFRGLFRFIRDFFRGRKAAKEFDSMLKHPGESC